MAEVSYEVLVEAIPVNLVVFHVEQEACLEEGKEETSNKVLLVAHGVVVEMWSGIAIESVMDIVEPSVASHDHVV